MSAYEAVIDRVTELVTRAGVDRRDVPVPACPLWTVGDVLAHLAGSAHDVTTGSLAGAGTPEWTAAQVDARGSADVPTLLAEWSRYAPQIRGALAARGGTQVVMDALTHEQDLRAALQAPYRPSEEDLVLALKFLAPRFGPSVTQHATTVPGLGAIEAHTATRSWRFGEGDPGIALRADALDLMRSLTGRRTPGQIAELEWSDDPTPWLPAFSWGGFPPPAEPVEPLHGAAHRTD